MTTVTIKSADASGIGEAFSVRPTRPQTRPQTQPIGTRLGTLFKHAVRRAIEQALGTTSWAKPPRGITVRVGFILYLLLTAAFSLLLFGPLLWS